MQFLTSGMPKKSMYLQTKKNLPENKLMNVRASPMHDPSYVHIITSAF